MVTVAALQLNSTASVSENLDKLAMYAADAATAKVKLLVLPENFACMPKQDEDKLAIAEPFGQGPIQTALSELADKHQLWIVAGTLPIKTAHRDKVASRSLVYQDDGQCVSHYDKIHLFDVAIRESGEQYTESDSIACGDEVKVVKDTPVGRLGLSVCYDVRFPELYRKMAPDCIAVPAAFTVATGRAHWEVLLRARAIENLSFVIAPGQVGLHANKRSTYGHSMLIDPWGQVLAQKPEGEGLVIADFDLDKQQRLREEFPALNHKVLMETPNE